MTDTAEDEITRHAAYVVEHVNEEYPDAVLFAARVLGGIEGAARAVVTTFDARGVDVLVDGEHDVRLDFDLPISAVDQGFFAFHTIMVRARAASGESGQTSLEQRHAELTTIRTFLTTVHAVEDVHDRLRRITCKGGDLATFVPLGPDTFLYVLLPPPGRTELTIDQSFTWDAHRTMPDDEKPVGAYYTVRRWDPATAELEMLFVRHGDDGHASAWAGRAAPGDPVALWGPRTAYAPPAGTERYLLVADETGLPAVAAIIESLPIGTPVVVLAEVDDAEHAQPLPVRDGVDVRWLFRVGAETGTTTLLVDAVRALGSIDPSSTYAWGGGESRAMTAVRKHLRNERGFDQASVSMVGYWRHAADTGEASGDDE